MAKEIKTYTAELFIKEKHTLGESPFYDARTKTLSWVDITEGKFFMLGLDRNKRVFSYGQAIGSAVPAEKPGTYLIAGTDGLYLEDTDAGNAITSKTANIGLKILLSDGTYICSDYSYASACYECPYSFLATSDNLIEIIAASHRDYYGWEQGTGTYAIKYTVINSTNEMH